MWQYGFTTATEKRAVRKNLAASQYQSRVLKKQKHFATK